MDRGPGKSSFNEIISQDSQELAAGQQNVTAACPKDKLEFNVFRAQCVEQSNCPSKMSVFVWVPLLIGILLGDLTLVVIMLSNDVRIELIKIEESDY